MTCRDTCIPLRMGRKIAGWGSLGVYICIIYYYYLLLLLMRGPLSYYIMPGFP